MDAHDISAPPVAADPARLPPTSASGFFALPVAHATDPPATYLTVTPLGTSPRRPASAAAFTNSGDEGTASTLLTPRESMPPHSRSRRPSLANIGRAFFSSHATPAGSVGRMLASSGRNECVGIVVRPPNAPYPTPQPVLPI
jgi:hypothetical protein